jgi:hypothetical protein
MYDHSYETIQMFNQKLKALSVVGFVSLITAVLGCELAYHKQESKWQQLLLSKGYGEYNKKTGEWQLCEPEVVLLNHNTEAIKVLNGGTVTINDYLTIIETDLKRVQDKVEEQAKELIEQDLLIEKYKKSIKIPGESSDKSKKSSKSPPGRIDVSKLF